MTVTTFKDVATGIKTALAANASLTAIVSTRVYRGSPGVGAAFPMIRMQQQANSEDVSMLGGRVFQYFYTSVIACSLDGDQADTLSGMIDGILERGALTIQTSLHSVTQRIGGIWYQEGEGNIYTHSGGIYRIGVKVT